MQIVSVGLNLIIFTMHHNFIFLSISFNFSALVLGLTPIRSNVIHSDAIRSDAIRSDASSDVPFYSKCKGLARGNFDMPKNHKKNQQNRIDSLRFTKVAFLQKKKKKTPTTRYFEISKGPPPKLVGIPFEKDEPMSFKSLQTRKKTLRNTTLNPRFGYQVT